MTEYTLRFRPRPGAEQKEETFSASSVGEALDIAKRRATGKEAELLLDGRRLCTLALVEDSGVWLVKQTAEAARLEEKGEG